MSVRPACPRCGSRYTRASGTTAADDGATLRRRVCNDCGKVFMTLEETVPDGGFEPDKAGEK